MKGKLTIIFWQVWKRGEGAEGEELCRHPLQHRAHLLLLPRAQRRRRLLRADPCQPGNGGEQPKHLQ